MLYHLFCFLIGVKWIYGSTNTPDGRPTLILSTPSFDSDLYDKKDEFGVSLRESLLEFQINFAKIVMRRGKENVIIACDAPTCQDLANHLPIDILWKTFFEDIWIRDFGRVEGLNGDLVGFRYFPKYDTAVHPLATEREFDRSLEKVLGITLKPRLNIILDGGNVVDNGLHSAMISDRAVRINARNFSRPGLEKSLKQALVLQKLIFIPELQEDATGNADTIVAFPNAQTVGLSQIGKRLDTFTVVGQEPLGDNETDGFAPIFKNGYLATADILDEKFPYPAIMVLPFKGDWRNNTRDMCGNYAQMVTLKDSIYVPAFGKDQRNDERGHFSAWDNFVIESLENKVGSDFEANKEKVPNLSKQTVTLVPVSHPVCSMGGSPRSLSMSISGKNADYLVKHVQRVWSKPFS